MKDMKNDYTMSKLEQYAMAAMPGMINSLMIKRNEPGYTEDSTLYEIVVLSFDIAEYMVAEGEKCGM